MKFFIFCLWFSLHSCIFASESKQSLFIVDGDSVNINVVLFLDLAQAPMEELGDKTDLKMRIAGIDTPEIKQTCEIEQGKSIDCGVLTKDYLQRLLESEPGDLVIKPIGVDYYHRILIRLFKGETDIGKKMVEDGKIDKDETTVCYVTGNGLKATESIMEILPKPQVMQADVAKISAVVK